MTFQEIRDALVSADNQAMDDWGSGAMNPTPSSIEGRLAFAERRVLNLGGVVMAILRELDARENRGVHDES